MAEPGLDAPGPPALRVDDLEFHYGRRPALVGVTLSFDRGVHGILGPNGAGKTTLLRVLATAEAPQSGRIQVAGRDPWVGRNLQSVRSSVGYMPQKLGFHPRHTVEDFLQLVTLLKVVGGRRARRAEIGRVLEVVGLAQRSKDRIGTLSGGMRQRLGLACALVKDPPILIMDEPTVGLDPEQRSMFRELASNLGTEHAVVISTHQTEDVSALCRTVHVVSDGRVVFSGPTVELVERARGRVWESPDKEGQLSSWITGSGTWRNLGSPPPATVAIDPTVEDGYLVALAEAAPDRRNGRVG